MHQSDSSAGVARADLKQAISLVGGMALALVFALALSLVDEAGAGQVRSERAEPSRWSSQLERALANELEILTVAADLIENGRIQDWQQFQDLMPRTGSQQMRELIGWAPRVSLGHREGFEQATGQMAYQSFVISEPDRESRLAPAAARAVYFPLTFTAPAGKGPWQLGFDLGAQRGLAALLHDGSEDSTGQIIPLSLAGTDTADALLILLPVRDHLAAAVDPSLGLKGYLFAVVPVSAPRPPLSLQGL